MMISIDEALDSMAEFLANTASLRLVGLGGCDLMALHRDAATQDLRSLGTKALWRIRGCEQASSFDPG
jgi:hypothetical protein